MSAPHLEYAPVEHMKREDTQNVFTRDITGPVPDYELCRRLQLLLCMSVLLLGFAAWEPRDFADHVSIALGRLDVALSMILGCAHVFLSMYVPRKLTLYRIALASTGLCYVFLGVVWTIKPEFSFGSML